MSALKKKSPRRVLIISSHSLFGHGLMSLLHKKLKLKIEIVGMVASMDEAIKVLDTAHPDLIIVDYDDQQLTKQDFLSKFVDVERKLRVVFLSLANPEKALIMDRQTLTLSQVEDWLDQWSLFSEESEGFQLKNVGDAK